MRVAITPISRAWLAGWALAVLFLPLLAWGQQAEPGSPIQFHNVPVPNQAFPSSPLRPGNADDEAAAAAFAKTFQWLVKARSWLAVGSLAPLVPAFRDASALRTPAFANAWRTWQRQHLLSSWVVDEDGRGLWKTEDGVAAGQSLTLGLRRQGDGAWWLVLVRTRDRPGQSSWDCSPTCTVGVDVAGRHWSMQARPPLGYAWKTADAIGAPVPLGLLTDLPGQLWTFQPPGEDPPATFDLSWWHSICADRLSLCPPLPPPPVRAPSLR
jgi:hypothetical protein